MAVSSFILHLLESYQSILIHLFYCMQQYWCCILFLALKFLKCLQQIYWWHLLLHALMDSHTLQMREEDNKRREGSKRVIWRSHLEVSLSLIITLKRISPLSTIDQIFLQYSLYFKLPSNKKNARVMKFTILFCYVKLSLPVKHESPFIFSCFAFIWCGCILFYSLLVNKMFYFTCILLLNHQTFHLLHFIPQQMECFTLFHVSFKNIMFHIISCVI